MRIDRTALKTIMKFEDLCEGECFFCNVCPQRVCLKTEYYGCKSTGEEVNSVDLVSGELFYMGDFEEVEIVKAMITKYE